MFLGVNFYLPAVFILGLWATTVAGVAQAASNAPKTPAISQLHEFSEGTWVENIAVRPNGQLLLTFFDRPELFTVDPKKAGAKPELVHKFSGAAKLAGITEYAPDKFAVIVGATENSLDHWSIWSIDMNAASGPKAKQNTPIFPEAEFLNGLTKLDGNTVLASDTMGGVLYRVNLLTGEHNVVLNDETTNPGINGVHYRAPYVYYTNTVNGQFVRVRIDPKSALPAGPVEVIAKKVDGVDDFALPSWTEQEAYVANFAENTVLRIRMDGNVTVFAKGISTPTSAAFGRTNADVRTLYVVSSPPSSGGGGKLYALKVQ